MHEILTLQLGHRANHLATHFWNTQESYFSYPSSSAPHSAPDDDGDNGISPVDHDIHWREGIGAKGEDTYTPRALIYDLKGGFGGLGAAHEVGEEVGSEVWTGAVTRLKPDSGSTTTIAPPSEYQLALLTGSLPVPKLRKETVRSWSDYNRILYHPRSMIPVNDYELNSALIPFERWETGQELFANMDCEVDLLDRDLRPWAEECDALQGVQVLCGGDDAWGGFAAKYVETVRDEYGKMAVWVWAEEEEELKDNRAKQLLRTINAARSLYEISAHASMYIPVAIPSSRRRLPTYVALDRESVWHTSALLSTAVESLTLPSRLRAGSGTKAGFLADMESALNANGNQRIAGLQMTLVGDDGPSGQKIVAGGKANDDRMRLQNSSFEHEDGVTNDARLDMDFLPFGSSGSEAGAFNIPHGTHGEKKKSEHVFGQVQTLRGLGLDEAGREEEDSYTRKRRRLAALPTIEKYPTSLRFPLLDSFPSLFVDQSGSDSIAVHASLSTTSRISARVKALQKAVGGMMLVQEVEREALSNGLAEIGEGYEEGWDSGSDDDSDS